jgi:phage gpG-like protein
MVVSLRFHGGAGALCKHGQERFELGQARTNHFAHFMKRPALSPMASSVGNFFKQEKECYWTKTRFNRQSSFVFGAVVQGDAREV